MISTLGHSAILLALVTTIAGVAASCAAVRWEGLAKWPFRAAVVVLALVVAATALMEGALISHDFSVQYVAEVGSRETPLYYTVISLWGALEGSILYWALLLAGYTAIFLFMYRNRLGRLGVLVAGTLLSLTSFFLFVIAGPGNPFGHLDPAPADGAGPNPLLQNHWMMGVHPQLLYLGYVGLSVPYALAVASLIRGIPSPQVLRLIRRWTLIPWTFLSLGIVAGMWWSYAVLGWGGYWSWDPVENASLMPWLVTTAFLHSLQVQERRGLLKTWTLSLIIAAFLLSILGTFLTRSGVLASVHSFTQSAVGPLFLAFFTVVLLASLGLLFARSRDLAASGALESAVCRETAFLVNNLLLVGITFTVLLGTIFPLIAEALQGTQVAVGGPYFNHVAVPIGLALLFLMGVGPALPWGAAHLDRLQYRLLVPVATGAATIFVLLLVGVRGVAALVTFGLSGFVLSVTLGRVQSDVRARASNTGEWWPAASARVFRANPRRYGGYLAHLGVLAIVIGIAASQTYGVRSTATLHPGQNMSLGGYRLTFVGWQAHPESNRMVVAAATKIERDGYNAGTLEPAQNYYAQGQPIVTPGIREEPSGLLLDLVRGSNPLDDLAPLLHGHNPFEDVYVVLQAVAGVNPRNTRDPRSTATLQVIVNPMVGFIWAGGIMLALGGLVALVPTRRRRRIAVTSTEPLVLQREEAVV